MLSKPLPRPLTPRLARLGLALVALTITWVAWLYWSEVMGLWQLLIGEVLATQRGLHRDLATAMRDVSKQGYLAGLTLIGLSFLYGVFHAAGPGHGKAVITTYLATQPGEHRSSLVLAACAALLQGVTAILAVELMVTVLASTFRQAQLATGTLEQLSFGVVAALGAFLCLVTGRRLLRHWRAPSTAHGHHCHHDHTGLSRNVSWWTALLSIGLRPCSGAILVLVLAHSLGLKLAGIAGVLAMSLGTALTVSLIALITVHARHLAASVADRLSADEARLAFTGNLIGFLGGLLILLMGISLISAGNPPSNHPLIGG